MTFWETLQQILRLTLFIAIPLLVVALAGLFSERSGVTNIALEGIMVIGAFTSAYFMGVIYTKTGLDGNALFFIGMAIAIVFGMIFSLLHAYASVSMKADQIISGTALNLFAPAFAIGGLLVIFSIVWHLPIIVFKICLMLWIIHLIVSFLEQRFYLIYQFSDQSCLQKHG